MRDRHWLWSLFILLCTTLLPLLDPSLSAAQAPASMRLKAVLIVGPIDGDAGPETQKQIGYMEQAATELEAHQVEVHRFYPGNHDIGAIERAAQGAHFFLYRGHGVYDGTLPRPNVGGLYLSGNQFYTADQIRQQLHLAPKAIVMLYGCFTAGSSSVDGDQYDIGIDEAARRVAQYAAPFFDAGAAGYYANWFGDAFQQFVAFLFAGQTLGQAYESYFDLDPATVYRTTYPGHPEWAMWLDKDNWDFWKYNNAFVGQADKTLADLFVPLSGVPSAVSFVAGAGERNAEPAAYTVTPQTGAGQGAVSWRLTAQGSWFTLDRQAGTTPQSFTIIPRPVSGLQPGTYTGTVTVRLTAPADVSGQERQIQVTLRVLARALQHNYLPLVARTL